MNLSKEEEKDEEAYRIQYAAAIIAPRTSALSMLWPPPIHVSCSSR
jgi:hypothetical protein